GLDFDAIPRELRAAASTEIRRVQTVVAEDAVHLASGVVAGRRAVEDEDPSTRAAEHQRRVEACRPGADDDAVPSPAGAVAVHGFSLPELEACGNLDDDDRCDHEVDGHAKRRPPAGGGDEVGVVLPEVLEP